MGTCSEGLLLVVREGSRAGAGNTDLIDRNWADVLRVAATMAAGTIRPSQILRKLRERRLDVRQQNRLVGPPAAPAARSIRADFEAKPRRPILLLAAVLPGFVHCRRQRGQALLVFLPLFGGELELVWTTRGLG